ncbi:MAG: hypothetical protein WA364_19145 [Candidatus Nitrosopolaris sp.]
MNRKYLLVLMFLVIGLAPLSIASVNATNESSYKYGFQVGQQEFKNCQTGYTCYSAHDDCQGLVDNMTACANGYKDSWEHSCSVNGTACVRLFNNYGLLPNGTEIMNMTDIIANQSSYNTGFLAGQNDTRTDKYDSQDACNNADLTSSQTYSCLKGYSDGDRSRYHAGYLQGVQDIGFKGHHTQNFTRGYFNGVQHYWSDRGLVEGYNGLPISSHNMNYTSSYRDGHAEMASGYQGTKKCGIDLGQLPTYTNDNYRDFYLGLDQGGEAYDMVDGTHYFLYNGPPGHTAEYHTGWRFGYGLGLGFDSDCGGVPVVNSTGSG